MKVSLISFFAALAVADAAASSSFRMQPWGIPRGGASSYASELDAVKEKVLASTLPSVRIVLYRHATPSFGRLVYCTVQHLTHLISSHLTIFFCFA